MIILPMYVSLPLMKKATTTATVVTTTAAVAARITKKMTQYGTMMM